ncbi:MAG: NAD(+) synthase [Lachnospiraceae bacterium]|nr:NAD(+) synthase [Lachnospiraceae bacterium]
MKDGFIRVAAATPEIKVADPVHNGDRVWEMIQEGEKRGAKIMVFPELCLTGYTCGDLFLQDILVKKAKEELKKLVEKTEGLDMLVFVGLPWERGGKLYNVAAAIWNGELLGLVTKTNLPNYSEFYELRHFNPGPAAPEEEEWNESYVPFGSNILFRCVSIPGLVIAGEICEDVWVMNPPSISHAMAGATVIVNCSASDETTGKHAYRTNLISGQSARLVCGYIYANAGEGESTQDLVFGAHNIIAENGTILASSKRFESGIICADLDLERLRSERRRMTTFRPAENTEDYDFVEFELDTENLKLERFIDPAPFVPSDESAREARCEEILTIQAMGLKKRLAHTGCTHAVVGISGGLDSTLALLVTARAFDMLKIPRENILSVTMPCFGTTDRTYNNACTLTKKLGAELKEVVIKDAVALHFRDLGHSMDNHDVTYENSQARERTQVLMDLANQNGGLVIGTGDMSELALGWATYNGDHMSMYGVNASVPKTLVRHLVRYYADTCGDEELKKVLYDVLDTPVSPELLPPTEGQISQKTEDLVGPYELHDFFMYYILRYGYRPAKIYRLAKIAFEGEYDDATIYKWLNTFYRRFFAQQFKRSCLPDGPKVGSVAVSPRGDLRMPSDAARRIWMEELETVRPEGLE